MAPGKLEMTSRKTVGYFVFFLFTVSLYVNCSKTQSPSGKIYRVIDHLNEANIQRSPITQIPNAPEEVRKFFPIKSSPLQDLGSGENSLGLKRKIKLGGVERNVLFSPPRSEFSCMLDIPENAALDFGIGIIRDENSETLLNSRGGEGNKGGVIFLVSLEAEGRKKTLFQKHLDLPSLEEDPSLSFALHSLDLPFKLKNAHLVFRTEGDGPIFAFWYNPVVYQRGRNDRNVILISVDTLRADHLGCYGYQRETSPNIDSLVSDSARFENTYASSPWTLPSHVSLLTSLHGVHHQVYYDNEKMDPSLLTLADLLKTNGFFCSAFTGGGFVSSAYGFSKGFDAYQEGEGGIYHQNSAELLFKSVSEWLDREKGKNFFLFLHTYQPHNPYACPEPYKYMFLKEDAKWRQLDLIGYLGGNAGIFKSLPEAERQNVIGLYDGEIRYTDERLIGPLIRKLKDLKLYDRTMIVFTSDHGEEFFDHKSWGHGHSLYDESLKVPLIIKFPNSKYRGTSVSSIVSLVDVMPTILDDLGVDCAGLNFDGKSLIPLIKGKEKRDRTFLADIGSKVLNSHIPQKISANKGRDKVILNKKFSEEDLAFFLFSPPSTNPIELYDLNEDPHEKNDLSGQKNQTASEIIRRIEDIFSRAVKRTLLKPEIDERLKEQLRALGYIR